MKFLSDCRRLVLVAGALVPFIAFGQDDPRARDLGIPFVGSPGPLNAITDVAGVTVGHTTLISGDGPLEVGVGPVRTGVTAILPRGKTYDPVFAGWYALLLIRFQAVFGTLVAALVVGLLPSTGLFTLWYLRRVRYHARHARFLYLAWVESQEISKLRETRRSVLAEIDQVRDEILAGGDPATDNQQSSDS